MQRSSKCKTMWRLHAIGCHAAARRRQATGGGGRGRGGGGTGGASACGAHAASTSVHARAAPGNPGGHIPSSRGTRNRSMRRGAAAAVTTLQPCNLGKDKRKRYKICTDWIKDTARPMYKLSSGILVVEDFTQQNRWDYTQQNRDCQP